MKSISVTLMSSLPSSDLGGQNFPLLVTKQIQIVSIGSFQHINQCTMASPCMLVLNRTAHTMNRKTNLLKKLQDNSSWELRWAQQTCQMLLILNISLTLQQIQEMIHRWSTLESCLMRRKRSITTSYMDVL